MLFALPMYEQGYKSALLQAVANSTNPLVDEEAKIAIDAILNKIYGE